MKTPNAFAGSLHPVVSRMVSGFKVQANPCGLCGYSAVMLHTMHGSGRDEFCFTCPNDDCNEHWKSPGSEMWQPTKQLAADKWNAANDPSSPTADKKSQP